MKYKSSTKVLSILLSLVMVLGLMPGMSLTALAATRQKCPNGDGHYLDFKDTMDGQVYCEDCQDYVMPVTVSVAPFDVTLTGGANATADPSDKTSQSGLTGAMTTVTYTANSGCQFPATSGYYTTTNGITVTKTSDTVVTVSGTPTADMNITVPDAVVAWSENQEITASSTLYGVILTADIKLTIPEGKTLTVNGGINASGKTLTVEGAGTLIVNGANGANSSNANGGNGDSGFKGTLIVNGATVNVTGGNGGNGGVEEWNGCSGGNGGAGVDGSITVQGGSATLNGGSGGSGGQHYADPGADGRPGRAVSGTITGKAEESDNGSNFTAITGTTSSKRYVKVEAAVPTHTHAFTYTASGATITATCQNDGCDLTDNKVSLTLKAPEHTVYGDGKNANVTIEGLDAFNNATGLTIVTSTIMYIRTVGSGTFTTFTPYTNAGDYTAQLTIKYSDTESVAALLDYTIAKADISMLPTVTGLKAVAGNTLESVTLPDGWAWADSSPNVGSEAAVKSFKANYTPVDANNYNTVENVDVTVDIFKHYEAVDATCEEDGVTAYYEDCEGHKFSDLGETPLTDEQTVIEKLDHSFIHFLKWVWDGFNHAIAWLFCDNDPEHIETIDVPSKVDTVDEPTCTEDGYNYYVATIDVAGKTYTTVNVETVDQLGHKWKESEWNIDGTKASLTLVCENNPSHTKTVDAAVGVTVNEEGTLRTYTAKVTVDGVEYTKTWTEDIAVPTPDVPTPDVPTPDVPTPDVPTPDVPTPDVPTPDVPTPDVPTPDVPTPDVPTPDVPTPDVPTPDEPTPDKPTPDEPTPDKPTPDEPTPAKEIKGILGDVNNDGQVDSADALMILRNSVGLETFDDTQRFLGDVNEDNENIDSSDALAVLRYSVGLIDIEKIGTPVSKTVA